MKLTVRCNHAPTSEGQWPLLRMCQISDMPGLQIEQHYRGALFMGATDARLCDVVQLLFRWTEQTLVVALTVCGKTHSGLCSRHGYRGLRRRQPCRMRKRLLISPAQPRRAETRLSAGRAAANEEANGTLFLPAHPSPVGTGVCPGRRVEPLSDARTPLAAFFRILLRQPLCHSCILV